MSHPQNFDKLRRKAKRDKALQALFTYATAVLCGGFALEMITWQLHDHYSAAIPETGYRNAVVLIMLTRLLIRVLTYEEEDK